MIKLKLLALQAQLNLMITNIYLRMQRRLLIVKLTSSLSVMRMKRKILGLLDQRANLKYISVGVLKKV